MDTMEWNLKTTGIIIAIFFLGYIIGLVESAIKQKNKDKKNASLEENELVKLPPAEIKQTNLFSINRNASNRLVLELEGRSISNKEELTAENKRLLVNLLVEVRPWLESKDPAPSIAQAEPKPDAVNLKSPAVPAISTPKATIPQQTTPAASDESIVSQITSVLQNRLAASHLASQGIRLQESPSGGVRVYIGLDKYDGIDAIPDREIKEFIRQAVAEWERQS
jgi:hypothetical protein